MGGIAALLLKPHPHALRYGMASEFGHMLEDHDEAVKLTTQQLGHSTSSINHGITAEYIGPRDETMIRTETETAMYNKRLESGFVAPHGAPIPDSDVAPILPGLITTAEINEWLDVNEPANTDKGRDSNTRYGVRDIIGCKRVDDMIQAGLASKAKERPEAEYEGGESDTDGDFDASVEDVEELMDSSHMEDLALLLTSSEDDAHTMQDFITRYSKINATNCYSGQHSVRRQFPIGGSRDPPSSFVFECETTRCDYESIIQILVVRHQKECSDARAKYRFTKEQERTKPKRINGCETERSIRKRERTDW